MNLPGKGPTAVITDLGIMTPDPVTKELTLTSLHPGRHRGEGDRVHRLEAEGRAASGDHASRPRRPSCSVLRDLNERTARAHAGQA